MKIGGLTVKELRIGKRLFRKAAEITTDDLESELIQELGYTDERAAAVARLLFDTLLTPKKGRAGK